MSNRNTVLDALVKHGTSTYDDIEKHTGMARNKLRWTMNAAKAEKLVEQTEDPLDNSVAWKITPAGRIALERSKEQETDEKAGSKPKATKKQREKGPQPKVGINNIGNSAPENLVEESGTPTGGAVVFETRAGSHGPEAVCAAQPAVSDDIGKLPSSKFPIHLSVELDGSVTFDHARYDAAEVQLIHQFLLDTQPLWSRHV